MAEHDLSASQGIGRDSKVIEAFNLGSDELNMRDFVGGVIISPGSGAANVLVSDKPTSQGGSYVPLLDAGASPVSIGLTANNASVMPDAMFHAPWVKFSGASATVKIVVKG